MPLFTRNVNGVPTLIVRNGAFVTGDCCCTEDEKDRKCGLPHTKIDITFDTEYFGTWDTRVSNGWAEITLKFQINAQNPKEIELRIDQSNQTWVEYGTHPVTWTTQCTNDSTKTKTSKLTWSTKEPNIDVHQFGTVTISWDYGNLGSIGTLPVSISVQRSYLSKVVYTDDNNNTTNHTAANNSAFSFTLASNKASDSFEITSS